MSSRRGGIAVLLGRGLLGLGFLSASSATPADVYNLTGLPNYPNLNEAAMDDVTRTDGLGRWCRHFSSDSYDSLELVEAWYRKVLTGASETDLTHDERYKQVSSLSGIKLALGVDYVVIYRLTTPSLTVIELYRCSP